MTAHRDLKRIIRARQRKTGEAYTTARMHVLGSRPVPDDGGATTGARESQGPREQGPPQGPLQVPLKGIVLKVNPHGGSARVRIPEHDLEVTLRSTDAAQVVPGHVVTVVLTKQWTWRGAPYASGRMLDPHVDIAALGLAPLPLYLHDEAMDARALYEPHRDPDPYAPLWRRITAKPRPCYEMDEIAWGAFPDEFEGDAMPVCDASDLMRQGDVEAARDLLMETLLRDLRCIDAHVHLGVMEFDHWPERARIHYEIAVGIGERSLPPDFDGFLVWGLLHNRPFLRALHALGLCDWRLGRPEAALATFERVLRLNPNDNQGIRFLRQDLLAGRTWEESRADEVDPWA